jgi:hypothetical protein
VGTPVFIAERCISARAAGTAYELKKKKGEGRSADGGLFIAIQPMILASQDAETQVLPAQPQPTGDLTITVISIYESEPIETLSGYFKSRRMLLFSPGKFRIKIHHHAMLILLVRIEFEYCTDSSIIKQCDLDHKPVVPFQILSSTQTDTNLSMIATSKAYEN